MLRVWFMHDSEFFSLIKNKLNKSDNVQIVTSSPADLILVDYDSQYKQEWMKAIESIVGKVVLFIDDPNKINVFPLLEYGSVASVVEKSSVRLSDMTDMLLDIMKGAFYMPSVMTTDFLERMVRLLKGEQDRFIMEAQGLDSQLTIKEAQIAFLIRQDLSNKEIARLLGMKEGTVKVHVSQIYSKLGVKDRELAIERLIDLFEGKGVGL